MTAHEVRRAAFRERLVARGYPAPKVDELVAQWEIEAGRRGLAPMSSVYWGKAWSWIAAQR